MDGQMTIFDYKEDEEHYCENCKYSYERSKFDLDLKGKWAYRFICTLNYEYKQVMQTCDKWEVNADE